MELEAQTNPIEETPKEGTPSEAPVATEAQAPIEGNTEAKPFTPDFKYKVMDKEYEIEEMYRPIIKDETTLQKVRRLHEQIQGLPHLEASRDEYKNKYSQVLPKVQEYELVEKRLDKLSHFVQNRDFGSFFNELKIPKENILQWIKSELEAEQLPVSVRQQMEQARILSQQKYDAEQELNYYKQQALAAQQEQTMNQIDQTIAGSYKDVAEQFNSRVGSPSAFHEAVIARGRAIQDQTGQKLSVSEVVSIVANDVTKLMGIQAAPTQAAPAAPQTKPPVIPVIKAGASSPVKTPPKNLDELKRVAAQM